MAAVSLFWDTNMAAVTSCENTLYKMAEQSFHSFHEEEIRELLTKNQGSKLTHTNSQNANDFDNLRETKISTNKRLRVRIIHVSQTF